MKTENVERLQAYLPREQVKCKGEPVQQRKFIDAIHKVRFATGQAMKKLKGHCLHELSSVQLGPTRADTSCWPANK